MSNERPPYPLREGTIPPRMLPGRIKSRQAETGGPVPDLYGAGGDPLATIDGNPQALPVLTAFHQFLENERRISRQRLLALAALLLLVLAIVAGGGAMIGVAMMKNVRQDFEDMQERFDSLRKEAATRSDNSRQELERLAEQAQGLSSDVLRQKESLARIGTNVDSRVGTVDAEMTRTKELIRMLEQNNTALKKDLDVLREKWPALASNLDQVLAEIARRRAAESPAAPPASPPDATFVTLILTPPGLAKPVTWRLPVPE